MRSSLCSALSFLGHSSGLCVLSSALFVFLLFFFLMIRRPPRSTLLSLHDALPILAERELAAGGVNLAGCAEQLLEAPRSEEHTSELQSLRHLVCRLLLEKKKNTNNVHTRRE